MNKHHIVIIEDDMFSEGHCAVKENSLERRKNLIQERTREDPHRERKQLIKRPSLHLKNSKSHMIIKRQNGNRRSERSQQI